MANYISKDDFVLKYTNEIICIKGLISYIEHCMEKARCWDGKCVNKNFKQNFDVKNEEGTHDYFLSLDKTYDGRNYQVKFYNNVLKCYSNKSGTGWLYCQNSQSIITTHSVDGAKKRFSFDVFKAECEAEISHLEAKIKRYQDIIDTLDRQLQMLKEINEYAKKIREVPYEICQFVDKEQIGSSSFIKIL